MRRQINSEELAILYNKIGQAIWFSQYLESALAQYIVLKVLAKEVGEFTEAEANRHQVRLNKQPLGRLIAEAESLSVLDDIPLNRLRNFNERRKWVVHNSTREDGVELYTSEGRKSVFDRLETFIHEAQDLHKFIGDQIVEYCVSRGKNKKTIYDDAEKHIAKLRGL